MGLLAHVRAALRRFGRDTRASVTVEFALMMPVIFWAYGASYVFFDAYRQDTINLKAAYTIGDMLSRETQEVNATYIDSLYEMNRLLIRTDAPLTLRISVVRWDADDDRYYVDWSQTRGGSTALTDALVVTLEQRLPTMPHGERVILVETWNTWQPPVLGALGETTLENFVFTRPRFAPRVVWGT